MARIITDYNIYDGRYFSDPDRAFVLEVCETLREAKEAKYDHGDNCIIVKATIYEMGEMPFIKINTKHIGLWKKINYL